MSTSKSDKKWYKILPIILTFIVIGLSVFNIYLNFPFPHLEIGDFPHCVSIEISNKGVIVSDSGNSTDVTITTSNETEPHYVSYDFSFILYNSGKGSAKDVTVQFIGEPEERFIVEKMDIFVGDALDSNLLTSQSNSYRFGLIGSGKSYTFQVSCKVLTGHGDGQFVFKITSENAGTLTETLRYEE